MSSILEDIRLTVGPGDGSDVFDRDLKLSINSAIADLLDVGVHNGNAFIVTGEAETWEQLLDDGIQEEDAKTFVMLQTRLIFDPPANGTVLQAYKDQSEKCLWKVRERIMLKKQKEAEANGQ